MTISWILCIVFQVLGLMFALFAGLNKKKRWILTLTLGANVCSMLVMIFAGRYDGAAATVICTIRAFLFLFQDRVSDNKIFWGCVAAHLIVGILSWQSLLSLLIIVAPIVLCYVNWFGSSPVIKRGTIFSCCCWTVFDFINGIYIEGLRDLAEIISNVIGIVRLRRSRRVQASVPEG